MSHGAAAQRVPFAELYAALLAGVQRLGLRGERAELCARLFAETTRDGVYTHGLNRFARFAEMVANGSIDVAAQPARVAGGAALERWDGRLGPGNTNAWAAMERAMELARTNGVGAVALANTNHWMRGGSCGWQAAEGGLMGACWTNTLPNLPPWGATEPALGNNPLVIAVPRTGGAHVVLDMAMSQFSFGALAGYSARGAELPVPGGYDGEGRLTRDAAAIERSRRALPVGYWKGAGLSLLLDLVAAMLAGGRTAHEISTDPLRESGVSQFFLALDPAAVGMAAAEMNRIAEGAITAVQGAAPVAAGRPPRYPGEETLRLREENLRLGVPVEAAAWTALLALSASPPPPPTEIARSSKQWACGRSAGKI